MSEDAMIDRKRFLSMLEDGDTHRKQFSSYSGLQKGKSSPTFSVPFDNGLVRHFLEGTGKHLNWKSAYKQFYCFLRTDADVEQVERWEKDQGTRVFIRNLLATTVAADQNFFDNTGGKKTEIGELEEHAKYSQDSSSAKTIRDILVELVKKISYLKDADAICAIPSIETKTFDLPSILAAGISKKCGLPNLTPMLTLVGKNRSAKEETVEGKWQVWENSTLKIDGTIAKVKNLILLDDKYQSGATMHFVASQLQNAGVGDIHGLVAVKTLRDTDNVRLLET